MESIKAHVGLLGNVLRYQNSKPHIERKPPYNTKKPGQNIKSDISATRLSA
jgi:hypothetical protein